MHEEEVLGKAYDARLMRRLLRYLRPYKQHVAIALAAIIGASVLQLAQPYLMKLAIDRYIARGDLAGLNRIAGAFLVRPARVVRARIPADLDAADDRAAHHVRHAHGRSTGTCSGSISSSTIAIPVGRLMTRVTTDVDVLNDLFTAGVVSIFGDVFTLLGIMIVLVVMDWRLALVAFAVLPLIVARDAVVPAQRARLVPHRPHLDRADQRVPAGAHHRAWRRCSCSGASARSFARFDEINRAHRDANVDSIFYYAVFYPAIEVIGALASALIIWFGGGWTLQGTLTLGSLVAFLLYSQRFFRPISDMSEKFNVLQAAMASSERIFKLLDTPVTIVSGSADPGSGSADARGTNQVGSSRARMRQRSRTADRRDARTAPNPEPRAPSRRMHHGHIVFDHVWFAYSGRGLRAAGRVVRGAGRASGSGSSARRGRGSRR